MADSNKLDSCRRKHINPFLYNIVVDYLSDRVLLYKTDRGMERYNITAGVPQGSVLGPLLWNIMYDGLLNLDLPKGATIIGYADDVALVISHELPQALEIIANDSLNRCDRWLIENGLKLAAEKTEAILVTDRRVFKMPEIIIHAKNVTFSNSLRYLGVQIDNRINFNNHIRIIRDKALKTANILARIMPNIHGPKDSSRRLINSVVLSQMMYAATIFAPAMSRKNTILQLQKPQRISSLRVISAYRTVSTSAALVLSGIPPIDLLIIERAEILEKLETHVGQNIDEQYINQIKAEARVNLIEKWQERWTNDSNGRWTYTLIPDIKIWINRTHGSMHYYLTQFMTGHGNFNAYLKRFKIRETDICDDCHTAEDSADHVLFHCSKWNTLRRSLNVFIGVILTPENMIMEMLKSENSWNRCHDFIAMVMEYRSHRITEPLISREDGGIGHR